MVVGGRSDAAAGAEHLRRLVAGRTTDDPEMASLVGELTMKSEEFAALWGKHPVANCMSGLKHMHHPEVGPLELRFEVLSLPDDSGQRVLMYTADPGTPAFESLQLLQAPILRQDPRLPPTSTGAHSVRQRS